MKKISNIINLQKIRNSSKQIAKQSNISNNSDEKSFVKLWVLLQNHYQHQNFVEKMLGVNGEIANLWRYEFKKHGIGFNEIVLIGNNLGELERPEFIPNVFQLIGIVKKIQENPESKIAHERVTASLPYFPSKEKMEQQRKTTKKARIESLNKIKSIVS